MAAEEREIGGYFVNAYPHDNGYSVEFEVWEEQSVTHNRELFFNGHVKWDGCSNWNIPPGNYQFHFCGREKMQEFADLLQAMFDWAAELMPDKLLVEDVPKKDLKNGRSSRS